MRDPVHVYSAGGGPAPAHASRWSQWHTPVTAPGVRSLCTAGGALLHDRARRAQASVLFAPVPGQNRTTHPDRGSACAIELAGGGECGRSADANPAACSSARAACSDSLSSAYPRRSRSPASSARRPSRSLLTRRSPRLWCCRQQGDGRHVDQALAEAIAEYTQPRPATARGPSRDEAPEGNPAPKHLRGNTHLLASSGLGDSPDCEAPWHLTVFDTQKHHSIRVGGQV
jgi:hypothetical protein